MSLDASRCGLDSSSLHRTTSMDILLAKQIWASLVSSRYKVKAEKLSSQLYVYRFIKCEGLEYLCCSLCKSNGVSIC